MGTLVTYIGPVATNVITVAPNIPVGLRCVHFLQKDMLMGCTGEFPEWVKMLSVFLPLAWQSWRISLPGFNLAEEHVGHTGSSRVSGYSPPVLLE